MAPFFPPKCSVSPNKVTKMIDNAHHTEAFITDFNNNKNLAYEKYINNNV